MPKRKAQLSQAEQSERFSREVQRLIDAGELDPVEADRAFEGALEKAAPPRRSEPSKT
jgi:hypothetical protein